MISRWVIKAFVQKTISYLPHKERINFWFQKNITKGVQLNDQYFTYKITSAKDHIKFFRKYSSKSEEKSSIMELGTGWYPIVPIAFYLSGFHTIFSVDLMNWTSVERIQSAIRKYIEWNEKGILKEYLPQYSEDRFREMSGLAYMEDLDLDTICKKINLSRIVGDARKTDFEDNSLDLICSNNTFEHIHENVLKEILIEMDRIASEGGILSHFIDLSDHFAHIDESISIYNFLKYSDRMWKLIDNSIQPQNRMRFIDYKELYKETGIPVTEEEFTRGDVESLKKIKLADKYKNYKAEDLAISHGYLISKITHQTNRHSS